jgi:signal transduction histidine kinase
MATIVDQLLALARLEAMPRPDKQSLDVATVVRELVGRMVAWAEKDGHSVELVCRRTAPIVADETALREAVRNLLENAVKHTPRGTMIRVEVAADGSIVVEDSGAGLPPEAVNVIVQPFRKGSAASEGAGLGLAIVKQAAELHGGKLEIGRSSLGGARCRITFGEDADVITA